MVFSVSATFLIPVSWFPQHRGKIIGIINSGFGLSATVFAPIQSVLVNPSNIAPEASNRSESSSYFTDRSVLANTPPALLYLAAIYLGLLSIGIMITREKPSQAEKENPRLKQRVRAALGYLVSDVLRNKDFWLLWASRYFLLICGAGIISHWKTFSFTQNKNDQIVSLFGGVR